MLTLTEERLWLTGKQVAQAVAFHLVDENWFGKEIPIQVSRWLKAELPEHKRISFSKTYWRETQTGTKRMLWLLRAAGLDPFFLCKFVPDNKSTQIMHRRFSDIIDTWHLTAA